MTTLAVIPARGGSKGIPGKNLARVGGVPLIERAIRACRAARSVDEVVVSTDDAMIALAARAGGAAVLMRPASLADDSATSESALLHALDVRRAIGREPGVLLLVQCTSPFLDPASLDEAVSRIRDGQADSCFAAVPTHEFLWRSVADAGSDDGDPLMVTGLNHDHRVRLRRQDRQTEFRETGAFYAMSTAGFREHQHRFFGRVAVIPVATSTAIEIDTPEDLSIAQVMAATLDRPAAEVDVDVLFTDFDGVHTDDRALVDTDGLETVRVSRGDGLGVRRLRESGVPMVIVSTETNTVVSARAAKLGVEVYQAEEDKAGCVRRWLAEHQISPERAAYLGNDVNDLPAMAVVGWPVAVADARPEVHRVARLVLHRAGGDGAVRELCDLIVARRRRSAAAAPVRARAHGSPGRAAAAALGG